MPNRMIYLPDDIYEKLKHVPNASALIAELLRNNLFTKKDEDITRQLQTLEEKKRVFLESIETQVKQFEKEVQEKDRQKETSKIEKEKEEKEKAEFNKKAEERGREFVKGTNQERFKRYAGRFMTDQEYDEFLERNQKEKIKLITFAMEKKEK